MSSAERLISGRRRFGRSVDEKIAGSADDVCGRAA
jgi:hypothetical protein